MPASPDAPLREFLARASRRRTIRATIDGAIVGLAIALLLPVARWIAGWPALTAAGAMLIVVAATALASTIAALRAKARTPLLVEAAAPSHNVIGGDLAMVLSLEWRVPIIYQLSGAVFLDNGGLFLTQCDSECRQQRGVQNNAFTFENFRHSVGPGLRYMTPVGPISLDYGFKLARRAGESIGEVHFSISGTF